MANTPEAHPDAIAAHEAVAYIALDGPIEYDASTGILSLVSPPNTLKGTPAEVVLNEGFYTPTIRTEEERLNLCFELGYLLGKREWIQTNG